MRATVAFLFLAVFGCDRRPVFSKEEIDRAQIGKGLPKGFLLGTATSAHQVEGGLDNDWTEWEKGSFPDGRPHIEGGHQSALAADSWNLFPEDLKAMRRLGVNTYRLSVEWSRLEPSPGAWDLAAEARYRSWLIDLRATGIEPMVTLQHVTLPRWVEAEGGWEWGGMEAALGTFAARVAAALGGQADLWCTLNEPNVAAAEAYLTANKPPGVSDAKRMAKVLVKTLHAHAAMAAAVRGADTVDADGDGEATRVGIAHLVQWFEPASYQTVDTTIAGLTDDFFNEAIPRAVKTGRIQFTIPGEVSVDEGVPGLEGTFDYLGLNYYRRDFVRFNPSDPKLATGFVPKGKPTNDLGWEVYPEGLYRMLVRFGRWGWPILITENGVSTRNADLRTSYLRSHLYAVEKAVEAGAPVEGYYHWSLIDNFEWTDGYESKFGLFEIDFDDPSRQRRATPAVATFQDVARNLGLVPIE